MWKCVHSMQVHAVVKVGGVNFSRRNVRVNVRGREFFYRENVRIGYSGGWIFPGGIIFHRDFFLSGKGLFFMGEFSKNVWWVTVRGCLGRNFPGVVNFSRENVRLGMSGEGVEFVRGRCPDIHARLCLYWIQRL